MPDPNKICATCTHVRLTLGIVTSLDFKKKLKQTLQRLTAQSHETAEASLDNNLVETLAFVNWLSKQKFYCHNEKSWTHLFDWACYAWQPRESIYAHHEPSQNPLT